MELPEQIAPFTIRLPWDTTIGATPVTEVTFDFERVNYRTYSEIRIGEYQNDGASASPVFSTGVAIAVNRFSFNYDPAQFGYDLVQVVMVAVGRHFVHDSVLLDRPPGIAQVPIGVKWPLSDDVVSYIDGGGLQVPIPRGIFAAFRLFPDTEYATADEYVDIFRGEPPAS